MLKFLVKRLAQAAFVLLVFLTMMWFLIQAQPGDVTNNLILNPNIPPESRELVRMQLGLDRPLWEQYFIYIGNFFQGEFGYSFSNPGMEVVEIIGQRLPRTIMLFLTATVISFYLGFAVGKALTWRKNKFLDSGVTLGGVYLFTIYTPWFAFLMLWVFGYLLDWFPVALFIDPEVWQYAPYGTNGSNTIFGYMIMTVAVVSLAIITLLTVLIKRHVPRTGLITFVFASVLIGTALLVWGLLPAGFNPAVADQSLVFSPGRYALNILEHMFLPILTLTIISFAGTMLLTRTSMLETLSEDYVMVARAKGLPTNKIRDRYVSRNAILPVLTSLILSLLLSIDGGVITETIFSYQGIGRTLVAASTAQDIPLALAAFVFVGVFALIAHILIDITYVFLDPRLRS